jgi:hypothetical protein
MIRPPCHTRAPRPRAMEVNAGRSEDGRQLTMFVPVPFEDRCATWDGEGIGPNGERYPISKGSNCTGCPWLPEWAKAEMAALVEANGYRMRLAGMLGPVPPSPVVDASGLQLEAMTQ